jgi:hypothetical protein
MTKGVNAFNAQKVLSTIKVELSAFLRDLWAKQPSDLSEQYTKKGPGRKHKQGKAIYIPRQLEQQQ